MLYNPHEGCSQKMLKVMELIDPDTKWWNLPLIKALF